MQGDEDEPLASLDTQDQIHFNSTPTTPWPGGVNFILCGKNKKKTLLWCQECMDTQRAQSDTCKHLIPLKSGEKSWKLS